MVDDRQAHIDDATTGDRQLGRAQLPAAAVGEQMGDRGDTPVEQLSMDALLPLATLVHQPHIQPAQHPDLEHEGRGHPRLRHTLDQQLAQVTGVARSV